MGIKPTAKHSIDRFPNNDGNYEPGNCRWATDAEQHNNTRANVKIDHRNQAQVASDLGVTSTCIRYRRKHGLDVLSNRPLRGGEKSYQAKLTAEQVKNIRAQHKSGTRGIGKALAEKYGVSRATICLIAKGINWASL